VVYALVIPNTLFFCLIPNPVPAKICPAEVFEEVT